MFATLLRCDFTECKNLLVLQEIVVALFYHLGQILATVILTSHNFTGKIKIWGQPLGKLFLVRFVIKVDFYSHEFLEACT